ncbi:MAG: RNA degradosome polyphosphate kinase, partial [Deltaproteobacteria bacterium]|nr:RNA degradosome polyphosphate kinase [Deltaproteobacteria bacterium]
MGRVEHRYNNRELSWLEFNRRVLQEALDRDVPLLERVKFLAIFSANLDEFFMVRVARLKRRIESGDLHSDPDGLSPTQIREYVSEKVHRLVDDQHLCFLEEIEPQLRKKGIRIVESGSVNSEQEEFLHHYFTRTLSPIITPLAIDPGHPFPYLANRSLCLIALVKPLRETHLPSTTLSVVHIPSNVVPRFIRLPGPKDEHLFMRLEDVVAMHLHRVYHGYKVQSCHVIRVTRDSDIDLPWGSVDDLLTAIEQG